MRATLWTAFLVAACGGSSPSTHKLTVTADGLGSVSTSPSGILCRAATCVANFAPAATVTLTAHPNAGASFSGWTGACSGVSLTCAVTISADTQVGASFTSATNSHSLAVTASGSGAVSSSPPGINCPGQCTASFTADTPVTLTATAQGGATFSGWTGACTGSAACAVTMSQDQAVTATFTAPANSHKLTVSVSGNGAVASSPAGISCPAGACASFFMDGIAVSLTATPDMNQTFSGWNGACSGTAPCNVTISADATVGATFSGPGY